MADDPRSDTDDLEDAQLRKYKSWFRVDKEHSEAWRKEAVEDFRFLAGQQWSDEEKRQLREQMRPEIVFNRTNPIINSISGLEISNRQEVKYYPREQGDSKADELLTDTAEWFRDLSNADDEDSDMFLDSTVCGVGATETTLSFEEDEEGQPVVSAINPLECYWDHSARKKNFTDANRKWRVRDMPLSVVMDMFEELPDGEKPEKGDLDARWAKYDTNSQSPVDREQSRLYEGDGQPKGDGRDETMVTIAQLQYKKRVTVYAVIDGNTGQEAEVPEDEYLVLKERADMVGLPIYATKKKVTKIMNVFMGAKILRETEALCPDQFSFQFVTCYMDRTTGLPYGFMRLMKDPQRWANKWMSQALHILNTNAKGGVYLEDDAVEDIREFERTFARPEKVTKVLPGALSNGKIQPKHQPTMDASFNNMMMFAIQSVKDSTGVSDELMGLRQATQAASLEAQRKQAGLNNLAPIFDNLRRYRRDQGKVMLYIIQNYLNDGRLVRINGEESTQVVPLMLQADVKYDIIVDDQVNTADQKMQVWQMMVPFIQGMPPKVLLELLEYSPFPPNVVEKIRKAAMEAMQPDPNKQQAEQVGLQLALQGQKADNDKTLADAILKTEQAKQIAQETQLEPIELMYKAWAEQSKLATQSAAKASEQAWQGA